MFAATLGAAVFVFVGGSHSVGLSPSANGGHQSTLPVGRTWACVAIYGHVISDDHCPTVALVCAPADEAAIKCATTNQRSATNRTPDRPEEHEQDFGGRQAGDFQQITACIY